MASLPRPWDLLHGHLGADVGALVDGQLDAATSERAWAHVEQCPGCRRLVDAEDWAKRQLASIAGCTRAGEPSDRLVGSLRDLHLGSEQVAVVWATSSEMTRDLEGRSRTRRRAGLALVGAGSLSAAVLGISTLGAPLGQGGTPAASLGGAASGRPSSSPAPASRPPLGVSSAGQPAGQSVGRSVLAPATTIYGRPPGFGLVPREGVVRARTIADH